MTTVEYDRICAAVDSGIVAEYDGQDVERYAESVRYAVEELFGIEPKQAEFVFDMVCEKYNKKQSDE